MVRVWVRVRVGDAVVRNAVGRKVGNHSRTNIFSRIFDSIDNNLLTEKLNDKK